MTVEIIVYWLLSVLLNSLQSVSVELYVCLELEFKAPLVLAMDGDRSLVFSLARLRLIAYYVAIRYKEIARVCRIFYAIWAEE